MLERIELHNQAIGWARIFHRPYSTIKFANNGSFELDTTYNERKDNASHTQNEIS
jgi:hypothetical protein